VCESSVIEPETEKTGRRLKTVTVRRKVLPTEINKYEGEIYENYYGKISQTTETPSAVASKGQRKPSKKPTLASIQAPPMSH